MKKKDDVLLGIDEAGRGPVIGPLVIAGVEINKNRVSLLEELNIKDSKELSFLQINTLFHKIVDVSDNVYVEIISNEMLNHLMRYKTLNEIEFDVCCEIISKSTPTKVFVDSFFSNTAKLEEMFKSKFPSIDFIVEHKADSKYLVVGAASIVAKYYRESEMEKIRKIYKEKYGDIGSGYSSDIRSVEFIERYYKEHKKFPREVRERWYTIERIKNREKQKTLF